MDRYPHERIIPVSLIRGARNSGRPEGLPKSREDHRCPRSQLALAKNVLPLLDKPEKWMTSILFLIVNRHYPPKILEAEIPDESCSKCITSWHQIRKCLRHCLCFAYARTGFAYAHILSYAELTLAYAHHSFACATPLQGPPCLTWTQGFRTWLR